MGVDFIPTGRPHMDADALLTRMTLAEKAGQVMMIGFDDTAMTAELRQVIQELGIGGVVIFGRNVSTPEALQRLTADLQAAAAGLPGLLVAIDQEGGRVARLTEAQGFTEHPSAMAVGATGDPANARRVAGALAAELRWLGINMNLAPVLDVNNNLANPVIGTRSFGADPGRVAEFGAAFIEGAQAAGLMAVGKHFPGHGDTAVDSHIALPTVPYDRPRLEAVELVPFKTALAAGNVTGIMSTHITFPAIDPTPGLPATLSQRILTGLLRKEMGYEGLILTDSLEMGALATSGYPAPEAAALALAAGADLLLFNRDHDTHRAAHARIVAGVGSSALPEARLDDAVRRVLQVKARYGLLAGPAEAPERAVDLAACRAIAQDVAVQAVTLVRDHAGLIPLPPGARTVIVETPLSGGLAAWLPAETLALSLDPGPAEVADVLARARQAERIIFMAADAARHPGQAQLAAALLDAQLPVILVAARDPYDLMLFPHAATCLALYIANPPMCRALAAVLRGGVQPRGRLPLPVARPEMIQLTPFEPQNAQHLAAAAAIWSAACGPDLAIGQRAVAYNTEPAAGGVQSGQLALLEGAPVGFVLTSAFRGDPEVTPREQGWVDAIAVLPAQQRRGVGGALLAWAERWLSGQGCTSFRLGGSLRPFVPGLPAELGSDRFFARRGYSDRPDSECVWDVAHDLRDYASPSSVRQGLPCTIRPARPGDEDALLAFLAREFPGRWHFECQEHLRTGSRLSDYLILLTEAGVEGFCQLTFEDSLRPLDRFFMHGLPRPWGQLGPIGVGAARRGGGYGAALLDAGLHHLRAAGVAGCVIDWTDLPDFYGKFGFQRYRQYEMLVKGNATGRIANQEGSK